MADRSVLVRLRADISQFQRQMVTAGASTSAFIKQLDTADTRMGNLVQTAMALAPALVPIGATAVPAITGLVTLLGTAATAAGVTVAAFSGVGEALDTLNDYQLDPTAENLEKLNTAMAALPTSAREFVHFLDREVLPALDRLQDVAADGVLPGAQAGIDGLLSRLPQVRDLVAEIADTSGDLMASAGADVASGDWDEFIAFLTREARPTLESLGDTIGNLAEGAADMLMGLDPLTDDFIGGLERLTQKFADLDPTSYERFVDYVQDVGPQVGDTLAAIGEALGALTMAAAPVGEVALPVIEAIAETLAAVASSPAGPVLIATAAGLSAVSRAVALYNAANGSALMTLLGGAEKKGFLAGKGMYAAAGGLAAIALSMTDVDEKLGLSNTAMFAMLGMAAGPWGAAIGGAVGLTMDFAAANDNLWDSLDRTSEILKENEFSLDAQAKQLEDRRKQLEAFKKGLGEGGLFSGFTDPLGQFTRAKNEVEGLVGTSDLEEAEKQLAELEEQYRANQKAAGDGAAAGDSFSRSALGAAQAAREEAAALEASIQAMRDRREEALRGVNASLDYAQALIDSREGVDKFRGVLKGLKSVEDAHTQDQIDAVRVLQNQAGAWNNLSDEAQNTPGAFREARAALIKTARELGLNKEAARAYADELMEIPRERHTEIRLDSVAALAAIRDVTRRIRDIKGKTVYIDIVTRGDGSFFVPGTGGNVVGRADGGTVPGPREPYGDKILLLAAPGEEVITNRNGEADRFRADRAAGRIPAYADGGTVGLPGLAGGGSVRRSLDDRLAIAQFIADIRQMRRQLRATGEDRLGKDQRRIVELQLKIAQRDLKAQRREVFVERQERLAERRERLAERAERRMERERDQLDRARQALAAVRSEANGFRDTVIGAVSSGNPFGNGLEGAMLTLEHDREQARQMLAGTRQAEKLGLSDAALRALLESGDVMAAQDIDTKAEVQQLNRLIAQTQSAQAQLGGFAREQMYGEQLRSSMKDVQAEVRELRQATREFNKLAKTMRPIHQHFPKSANPRSVASAAAQRLRAKGI